MSGYTLSVDGSLVAAEPERNPLYVTGAARTALETLLRVLPMGQQVLLAERQTLSPGGAAVQLASSLAVYMGAAGAGVWLSARKSWK